MFDEDLSVFFNETEFGVQATFTLPNGSTFPPAGGTFTVIFDDAFIDKDTGLISLETTNPQCSCALSDVQALTAAVAAANGGTAIISGQQVPLRSLPVSIENAPPGETYSLLQVQPEGTGTCVLALARES